MAYMFYLKKCLLPVTPEKVTTTINGNNKTVTLISEGEVNILKKAKLTDIEFTCLIPNVKYPFGIYKNGFQKASYFLTYFEDLKNSKQPFQFIITRAFPNGKSLYDTNMKVSLEDYKIEESADEGFDCKVTIKLKQWREYGTKTVKITIKNPTLSKKTVTLKKGKTAKLSVKGSIGKVTYKSSNTKIAAVSSKGVIKAKKAGKVTITVKSNGITNKCKVTVKNK